MINSLICLTTLYEIPRLNKVKCMSKVFEEGGRI